MTYPTTGPLIVTEHTDRDTGERYAEVRANLAVQGDLDVHGQLTQNGAPLESGGGITNEAPANAVPVTADADGNLDGSSALTFNLQALSLLLQGAGASLGITGGTCSFVMTGQNGDGALTFKLLGLPRTDPGIEGKLWINNGALMISDG